MKAFLLSFFVGFFTLLATAQDQNPVQFSYTAKWQNDSTLAISLLAKPVAPFAFVLWQAGTVADTAIASSVTWNIKPTQRLQGTAKVLVLTATQPSASTDSSLVAATDSTSYEQQILVTDTTTGSIEASINWIAKNGENYPTGVSTIRVPLPAKPAAIATTDEGGPNGGLSSIFLYCLLGGLLAVFTPCVFPLIPVTVSFFLKRSGSKAMGIRNALLYSASIILIYTIPTLLITLAFGSTALYSISTSATANFVFFAVFLVFAASFFGAFELSLPSSWANTADGKASKGGLVGIFFMAITLVIVSFSCTGPIVGTLLGQTSSEGITMAPVIGMLGFSIGLALPFSLFAFFPSLLQNLPKSGGWLNSVKVCFGFIELALALKFLSNIDLIYHWQLLNRDVFLSIWIVLFALMALYLLGKLKFSHDSDLPYISVPRLLFAIASLSFAVYLVPGLWGAPLKPLSGILPPATTQHFNLHNNQYASPVSTTTNGADAPKKLTDKLKLPFGLVGYFDLQEGLAASKKLNKPIMLDFTGHSCANCRKMEEEVWSDPRVLEKLRNNFVIVSLYVDERTEIPTQQQYQGDDGVFVNTVGEWNLAYQIKKFGINSQPLYMFIDADEKVLSSTKYGYNSNVDKFLAHLTTIESEYKKLHP